MAVKHFFVRQFSLSGNVVLLDEMHTYDLYTGTLIGELVKRLRELQRTIVILSATLTKDRRRELLGMAASQPVSEEYPLVSCVISSFSEHSCAPLLSKTIQARKVSGALPIDEAMERASRGECVLL